MDILNRLPVRSLLRFKCVSKFWGTLISDPYFKKQHLNHAKKDQNSQKLLISHFYRKDDLFSMYCCPLSPLQWVEDVQKLDCPPISKTGRYVIHCCCDGLVIIQVNVKRPILLLWNPSTRESIVLPDPEIPLVGGSCLGLGYDSTSGDYKILKIHTVENGFEILALKGGRWRNTDKHPLDITNVLMGMRSLAFVHEAFHWIVVIGDYTAVPRRYSLVSFSISNEVYGEIPLLEQVLCSTHDVTFGVSVFEGMLCVYSTSAWQVKEGFKLWVLKDYGIKESWNVLFTIHDPLICHFVSKYKFADGEVLFWFGHLQSHETAFRMSSDHLYHGLKVAFLMESLLQKA
ncbi:F-box protein CPR1-like isoform X1 [Lycium ferocissimum]|uniref:F-box protein CPR1-like isoform X1 n=1 Tax=Lycium ferocissimum TaxID=112874 RepID=UPI002814BFDF|nr:F-box protein CPR1-like isoform X1 [Lycium ferocissimum]